MIKGIGIDIVGTDNFRKTGNDDDFISQILTVSEIAEFSRRQSGADIAGLFAIKESVLKALGCGLSRGFYWHDIEIDEEYSIQLTGRLRELADKLTISKIHCSHSHSENYTAALVLLEG